jgi:hypothetical protein
LIELIVVIGLMALLISQLRWDTGRVCLAMLV